VGAQEGGGFLLGGPADFTDHDQGLGLGIGAPVEVPHLGTVIVDVAYGGMFYVIAEAEAFGLRLTPDEGGDIVFAYGFLLYLLLILAAVPRRPIRYASLLAFVSFAAMYLTATADPSVFDPGGAIRSGLGFIGQPVTVVFDARGTRVKAWGGAVPTGALDGELHRLTSG